ncbi:hypothetical protein CANARDRAFT_177154 [[Candida] arabinofermentans NRRL YB-2248]|uniref:Vps53 N-terminal domain-containing protein n=1 Tax=[Candida] arabinofermentans NRRL YB-2248 TaxID=983967 RepID=A0A1E4SWW3_9ASCO|nr:hypothetical protein CANARDRAFT_177154 [[Candida] arabinofermentans NRRL YB-2248]
MLDIQKIFDSPNSLGDLDELLSYTNVYKLQIDKEIYNKRKQYNSFNNQLNSSDDSLNNIEDLLTNLIDDFDSTKLYATTTGSTINNMTANIKKLDNSKKNLTLSMTILKRLQMLVTAYDNLNEFIDDSSNDIKNYNEIKQLLSVVMELMQYFQTYKSIDEINTLNKKIGSTKNKIIDEIFSDFEKEIKGELKNPQLIEGCNLLDTLGKPYHDKLSNWYITTLLKEISTIFKTTEEAGSLDNLKRRFIFFQKLLINFENNHLSIFPKDWKMSLKLCERFCELTKKDLKEVTSKEIRLNGNKVDVNLLLNSLSETLEFETFLSRKFKYYNDKDEQPPNFERTISDVFEPYLNIWVEHQGKLINDKFLEFMNPSNMFKKSGIDESENKDNDSSLNVLESAADLFRLYRQMLSQLSKLSQGDPMVKLSNVFSKYLMKYLTNVLEVILPNIKQLQSSTQLDLIEGIDMILLVLNTADYCSITVTQLEEKLLSLIQPEEIKSKVDFEKTKDSYLSLINNCINLLFFKIENDLQLSWREMSNFNWKSIKEVTNESRYLSSIKRILNENCEIILPKFNRGLYIRNFIDKLIELVLNELTINIIKLKPINEIMAEQFILDIQTLKIFLINLPNKSKTNEGEKLSKSTVFNKYINNKILKIESVLKILMIQINPTNEFILNYFKLIKDSNFSNFIKILKLKGLLNDESTYEKEKFKYLDHFKNQLRIYEQDEKLEQLEESNDFLTKLQTSSSSPKSSIPVVDMGTSITSFFNNTNQNFKIDKQSILNTRDQFEKNIVKTFNSINNNNNGSNGSNEDGNKGVGVISGGINENFKNFGKLFKKN